MISNTRGPAAMYTPPTYSPAEAQIAAAAAARPVSEPVTFKLGKTEAEEPSSGLGRLFGGMFRSLGGDDRSNNPFGNLSGVSSFTDESGNVWTRNSSRNS